MTARKLVATLPMRGWVSPTLLEDIRTVYKLEGWRNVDFVGVYDDPTDAYTLREVQVFADDLPRAGWRSASWPDPDE